MRALDAPRPRGARRRRSSPALGPSSRSSPPTSATPGERAVLNLGPHRRSRDRGGERLRALSPRRGRRARTAGGASDLGGGGAPRPRSTGSSAAHGLPDHARPRRSTPTRCSRRSNATRSALRTESASCCSSARASRRSAGASTRRRCAAAPSRSFDERTASRSFTASTSTCSAAATRSTTGPARSPSSSAGSSATPTELELEVDVLPVQPRGRVRRVPSPPARARRRRDPQRRRVDPLQLRDPRRARDRGGARGRGPPLRRPGARGVAAELGVRGARRSGWSPGEGPDGYRERARDAEGGARAVSEGARRSPRRPARRAGLDTLLVGDLVRPGDSGRDASSNLRWLTGFSGTSGLAVVGADRRAFCHRLPLRRARRARGLRRASSRVIAERELIPAAVELPARTGRLRRRPDERQEPSPARGAGRRRASSWCRAAGVVEAPSPPTRTRASWRRSPRRRRLTDQVYEWVFERGVVGRTRARDHARRPSADARAGGRGPVVPGDRGAPARTARCRTTTRPSARCGADELLLIDMGAIVDGYCSDCTRTVATGELDDDAREVYELVRSAQQDGPGRDRAGRRGPRRGRGGARPDRGRRATASASATAWGTGSASRSTRRRGCRESRSRRSRPATW